MKELHAEGANLLSVDGDNMTPLHHAAKLGSHDVVKYLIDNGNNLFFITVPFIFTFS